MSCQSRETTSESKVIRTAKQDAPLAVLMREMFVDMEEIKMSVTEKENLGAYMEKHQNILIAKATDPAVRDSSFQIMADAYLVHLGALENSQPEKVLENYRALQQSCVACHQQKCPGPIKKINSLKVN